MKIFFRTMAGNHPNYLPNQLWAVTSPDIVPSQTDFRIFHFFSFFSSKEKVYEIRPIWNGFSLNEDFFILDLKKLREGDQTMCECSKLHWYYLSDISSPSPFLQIVFTKKFIECVSSPYVDNFILLDSNLTNSMKSNF